MMEPDQQLRNLRDFLLVYNRMTEICFQRCSSNFNYRNLTMDEDRCVDNCAGKLIRSNHRLMSTYVQLMPKMVQRRMDEMQSKAAEAEAAAAAAAAATTAVSVTDAPTTTDFSIDQTSPQPPPSYPSPAATDSGPLQVLTGPGQPLGVSVLDSSPAAFLQPAQSNMAAPTPLTPATAETFIPTRVDSVVTGPAPTIVSPLPGPTAGSINDAPLSLAHIPPPVVPGPSVQTPATPESLTADVSTISKA